MEDLISTTEAAERLGVSPQRVRALWHAGSLSGQVIASRLLLDRVSVLDLKDLNRPATRPLSPRNAWTLLLMIAGEETPWASSPERSRLRRLASTRDESALATLVRSRARTLRFDGVPRAARYVAQDAVVIPAGTTQAHRWTELVADGGAEVYATSESAQGLRDRFRLWSDARGPIAVHVVPNTLNEWLLDRRDMPASVVAVDLLESADARTRRAGQDLWQRSVEYWRDQRASRHHTGRTSRG